MERTVPWIAVGPCFSDDARAVPALDPKMLDTLSNAEIARMFHLDKATLVELAEMIAQDPTSTIAPPQCAIPDASGRTAIAELDVQRERGICAELDIGPILGEGGMAVVRIATQRSLGRSVAIKRLRPSARNDRAVLSLLRETWVISDLEHPNIVPVYDLGVDEDGSPIIVLKHIEGVAWRAIMDNANAVRERGGADLLEYNLRVLIHVCSR
jgi:serine/threonine-protein kinase